MLARLIQRQRQREGRLPPIRCIEVVGKAIRAFGKTVRTLKLQGPLIIFRP